MTNPQKNILIHLENGWRLYEGVSEVLCRPKQEGIGSRTFLVRLATLKAMKRDGLVKMERWFGIPGVRPGARCKVYGPK